VVETGGGEPILFTPELGNLVGSWPSSASTLAPGESITAELDLTVAAGAPTGDYTMTLELVDVGTGDPAGTVLATDIAVTTVQAAGLSVQWTSALDYVAQGVNVPVTARVFNPDLGQDPLPGASLRVTLDAPEDFVLAGQVSAYSDAVEMPFVLTDGDLVGSWPLTDPLPVPYDESITWTLNIGEGAPIGIYRLEVDVLDGSSAVIAGPAVNAFVVGFEDGAPVVTITEGPNLITNQTSATFAFQSSVATTRYECKLDGAPWESCESPVTVEGLEDGEHVFAVSTTVGGTAVRQWTVDTVAPEITWMSTPPEGTSNRDAMFEFATDGEDEVLCSLDGAALASCSDPVTYQDLDLGDHQVLVAAIDAAGNHASLTHRWRVATAMSAVGSNRVADTRSGWVASDGRFFGLGAMPAGQVVEVPVAGRAGVPLDAEAVIVNVTVAGARGSGFATVFPCGVRPGTSSVNFEAGRDVANEVIAELSGRGSVCVYTHVSADVIVDVVGHF
jgi:hypothetical protein